MEKNWFAVRTKPRQELYAKEQFNRQGFEVYLPQTLALVRHARKKNWVKRPFFPNYLFLHLGSNERRWSSIASTYGAIGAVRFGDNYPLVPEGVISYLIECEDEYGRILSESRPGAPFRPEQRVRIVDGSMKGLEGTFMLMSGRERVQVMLDLLSRSVNVHLPLEHVEAS